jgi:D-3-phosphoglycerate dehydrogenase / 2-oxoglutarate reductase
MGSPGTKADFPKPAAPRIILLTIFGKDIPASTERRDASTGRRSKGDGNMRSDMIGHRPQVLVSTIPFCEFDPRPLEWLAAVGADTVINPLGRRLKEEELAEMIGDFDYLIAGTEPVTALVMQRAKRLRMIARVGVGLDSVDLAAARRNGIAVAYTPEAPAPAVAELTIGMMLDLLRHVGSADRGLRAGKWNRFMGRRIADCAVGVIGVGRIGKRVIQHLAGGFPGVRLLAHDIVPDHGFGAAHGVTWVDPDTLYRESDVVTMHVPLTSATRGMIGERELLLMKRDAVLINAARGGIVDEAALLASLTAAVSRDVCGHGPAVAAIDTFMQEPYDGPLAGLENCLLTCHMGSMTRDCRSRMEVEATEEVVRMIRGEAPASLVPQSEYPADERQPAHAG